MGIGFKLSLGMAVVLASVMGLFYWYYNDSQAKMAGLIADNAKLTTAVDEQKQAIDIMQKHSAQQAVQVQTLQQGLNAANADKAQLEKTLRNHDLAALARENPALLEGKMNRATARVWQDFETLTGAKPNPATTPTAQTTATTTTDAKNKSPFKKLEDLNATAQ